MIRKAERIEKTEDTAKATNLKTLDIQWIKSSLSSMISGWEGQCMKMICMKSKKRIKS